MAIKKKTSGLQVTTDSSGKIVGATDSKGSYSVDSSGKATLTSSSAPKPTRYTQPSPLPRSAGQVAPQPITSTLKPTLETIDEKAIRNNTRKRMQSSIDAINANYANLISQEKVQGEDRSGQTRALNARSGTIGSDFGQAAQEKTTTYNKQQQQYLVDQQNAQVASVMQSIEDRASAEIQMRKNEALGKYQMDVGEFEKAQQQARGDFELLAKSGTDLNSLNPAQKAALFKQAGYDDTWGDLIFNAMKPKASQIDYKFEKLAEGQGMFYGTDPVTGELVTKKVSVDLPPDWQMEIAPDGTVLGYNKNSGEVSMLSGQGQFLKPETGLDSKAQTRVDGIVKQFDNEPVVRNYNTVAEGYQFAKNIPTNTTNPSDDIGMIYAFAKIMDPNSVVREGEYATVQKYAQSWAQSFGFKAERIFSNSKFLSSEAIGNMKATIKQKYDASKQNYENVYNEYGRRVNMVTGTEDGTDYLTDYGAAFDTGKPAPPLEQLMSNPQVQQMYQELYNSGITDRDVLEQLIDEKLGFKKVGTDTKSGVKPTAARTDRHNNPTAFTTDIAKLAGLVLGKDYTLGDPFPNNSKLRTAKILGDPIATTIKVINKIGFYTQSGKPRWTYTNSIPQTKSWNNLSYTQKAGVIKQMYKHEGGSALLNNFA
jgi:hypothetical protein